MTIPFKAPEERALLAPSFLAILLWQAAKGKDQVEGIPFELAFLMMPLVLHRETRENLPRNLSTSLAVWLNDHPLLRSNLPERARLLVPFTKEALIYGGTQHLLQIRHAVVYANPEWKSSISRFLNGTSDDVKACANRAEFVGRWFRKLGDSKTVMALMGVKP